MLKEAQFLKKIMIHCFDFKDLSTAFSCNLHPSFDKTTCWKTKELALNFRVGSSVLTFCKLDLARGKVVFADLVNKSS